MLLCLFFYKRKRMMENSRNGWQLHKKRRDALNAGETFYDTDKPCIRGHLAYRYAASGNCSECVRIKNAENAVINTPLAELLPVRLRLFDEDVANVLATAYGLTAARYPGVTERQVLGKKQGIKRESGAALYTVNIDLADVKMMRDIANALMEAKSIDGAAARARIVGQIEAAANERDNGAGDWKFT